ncbi:hypothetical protein PG997_010965 [Apiospora hydei]|uniref:Uncharacterized protein n=1 Tax=Apiospora hydei TaxID=1337664 RepID=A0ABR1VIQ0_9PEZI
MSSPSSACSLPDDSLLPHHPDRHGPDHQSLQLGAPLGRLSGRLHPDGRVGPLHAGRRAPVPVAGPGPARADWAHDGERRAEPHPDPRLPGHCHSRRPRQNRRRLPEQTRGRDRRRHPRVHPARVSRRGAESGAGAWVRARCEAAGAAALPQPPPVDDDVVMGNVPDPGVEEDPGAQELWRYLVNDVMGNNNPGGDEAMGADPAAEYMWNFPGNAVMGENPGDDQFLAENPGG